MVAHSTIRLRTRLPIIGLLLLTVLAILFPSPAWTIPLVSLALLVAISWLWVRSLAGGISAERKLSRRWVAVGDRLEEQFTLRNKGLFPAIWLEISDSSNLPAYKAASVRAISSYGETRWRSYAICEQRGRYTVGPWALHSSDLFGFFDLEIAFDQTNEIIIHPPIHSNLPILLPAGFGEGQTRIQRRTWQAAHNVSGLRDYQPQDPFHHIHWRKSASSGSLKVRQFDRDTAGDIWILLDLDGSVQLGSGLTGTEEHAVLLAASLAARSLAQKRAVGIAAYGKQPLIVPPARGEGQQWRILQALALISAESTTNITRAINDLSRVVHGESAVLIITANTHTDWLPTLLSLKQRGVAITIAPFDRPSFGGSETPDGLENALTRMGIDSYRLHRGATGQAPEITNETETVVTPLGRTIVRQVNQKSPI